jgi:XTP/dITP diphosphohydrolase
MWIPSQSNKGEKLEIFFITSNKNKVLEGDLICSPSRIKLIQKDIGYEEKRGEDCEEIVLKAIEEISKNYKEKFIIEDSGIFIEELNNFPGAYSKWVYNKIGCEGIIKLMEDKNNRNAKFISVIGYFDGEKTHTYKGEIEGIISNKIQGEKGFGYDPLFIPKGYKLTFAENSTLKHSLSHRTRAFQAFAKSLK